MEQVEIDKNITDLKTEAKKYSVTPSKKEVNLARAFLNVKDQEFVSRNFENKVETELLKEFIQNKIKCEGILLLHDVDYLEIRNLEIRSSGRTPSRNQFKDVIVVTFSCAPIFFHNKIVLDEEKVLDYKMNKDITAKEEELNQANIKEIKQQTIEAGKRKRKEINVESDNTDAYDDIIYVLEAEIESLNNNGGSNLLGLPVEEIKSRKEKILEKLNDVKDYVIFQKQKYSKIDEELLEVRKSIEENEEKQLKIENEDTKSIEDQTKYNKLIEEMDELISRKEDLEMIGKLDYTAMQNTLLQPVNDKIDKNHILFSIQFLDWRRVVGIGTPKRIKIVNIVRSLGGTVQEANTRREKVKNYTLEAIPLELQYLFFDGEEQQSTIDNDDNETIVEDNYRKVFPEDKDWNGVDKNERDKIFEKESDESWESYIERIEREKMSKEDKAMNAYLENLRKAEEEQRKEAQRKAEEEQRKEEERKRREAEQRKRREAERKRLEKKQEVLSEYDNEEDIPLSDNTDSDDSDDSESDDDFPDIVI